MSGMIISVMWQSCGGRRLQSAPMEVLRCSAGVAVLKGHGWQLEWPLQAADLSAQAGSWPGGVILSPGCTSSWQHSCTVQMPAAQAKLHSQQGGTRRSASVHGTHMSFRPARADHAAGRVPFSWLPPRGLHLDGDIAQREVVKHSHSSHISALPPNGQHYHDVAVMLAECKCVQMGVAVLLQANAGQACGEGHGSCSALQADHLQKQAAS
jgi:hypothetical protein